MNLPYPFHVLKRNRRIGIRQTIESILKDGSRLNGRFLLMLRKENEEKQNRYAVIVSKKVHKSAVKRNKIRRRIYESIRISEQNWQAEAVPNGKSYDIVVLARSSILEKDFTEIFAEIQKLLQQ